MKEVCTALAQIRRVLRCENDECYVNDGASRPVNAVARSRLSSQDLVMLDPALSYGAPGHGHQDSALHRLD